MSEKYYVGEKPTGEEVRQAFVDFFCKQKEHVNIVSSATIPHNDPTLLFANAGMNQFKPIFLGTVDPNSDFGKLKRAANSQKCIRAGGKHNDLDDVGKDVYHHTFFEMLGNWSFGNYFKEEAIAWAWELLTGVYKIDPNRLYATYFRGDESVPADNEAREIWLKYLPAERILPFDKKANFWEMGETGPCGPCTEIHFDRIGGRDAAHLVNLDDPNVLEIWNLVFIQFNRESDGSLRPLPNKHVDTGMGLERVTSVLQGVMSNYDTDLFQSIFAAIQAGTGVRPYTGKVGAEDVDGVDTAYRVVADHIRTLTIAISDGGLPDSVGRGYILRLILRRAIRFLEDKIHAPQFFFETLVDTVVAILGNSFPEIKRDPAYVKSVLHEEEASFRKTLARGERLFAIIVEKHKADKVIPGPAAWQLYDTYGFPIDLTKLMADERGFTIDRAGYEAAKAAAIARSQGESKAVDNLVDLDVHAISELKLQNVPETDESPKYNYQRDAQGVYSFPKSSAKILAIRHNKTFVQSVTAEEGGAEIGLILDATPFYAEQGGQIADHGFISSEAGSDIFVSDVQKKGPYTLHIGSLNLGTVSVGDVVSCGIDETYRRPIMSNHTATHVLNYSLRNVIGDSDQKGSLVDTEKLRFDFSAKKALDVEDIAKTEAIVNKVIGDNLPVFAKVAPLALSKEIEGVRAMFGEVYPDPVRVVSVGKSVEELLADPRNGSFSSYSVEFCGGTHLFNSGDIGSFRILSEDAISKGIRRIVGATGPLAAQATQLAAELEQQVHDDATTAEVNAWSAAIDKAVIPIVEKDRLRKRVNAIKVKLIEADKKRRAALAANAEKRADELIAAGVGSFVVEILDVGADLKAVLNAVNKLKASAPQASLLLFSTDSSDDDFVCQAFVPKEVAASKGLKANEWIDSVKATFPACKGGGRDDTAQLSGKGVSQVSAAAELARQFASLKLQ